MKKIFTIGLICAAGVVLLPSLAHASSGWEYITYGGGDAIYSAWQKVALIFSDNNYKSLFPAIVLVGIFSAIAAVYVKAHTGYSASIGAWAVPALVGIMLYLALIVPKNTSSDPLYVYDNVMNYTSPAVTGIPEGIVYMAGLLNEVQVGLVNIIDTSSLDATGMGYSQNAGGEGFNLLFQTGQESLQIPPGIQGTINQYTKDCVLFSMMLPSGNPNQITVASLQNSSDFTQQYAKAANPAIDTLSYIVNSSGDPVSCQQAWNDPTEGISNAISAQGAWTNDINNICAQSGFDPTNSDERNQCIDLATNVSSYIWNGASYGLSNWIEQKAFADSLYDTLNNTSTDQAIQAMASRQIGTSWLSAGLVANTWVPVIMSSMTVLAICLLPIMVLFIPTPLAGKAVSVVFGMFLWVTLWVVIDALIHGFGVDYAAKVAQQLKQYNLGAASISYFPTFGMKTLAAIGNMRWMGLMVATVISGILVKFGGSALARVAGGFTGASEGAGAAAGQKMMDPQANAAMKTGEHMASATESFTNEHSFQAMVLADRIRMTQAQRAAKGVWDEAGRSFERLGQIAETSSAASTAKSAGTGTRYQDFAQRFNHDFPQYHGGSTEGMDAAREDAWASNGMNPSHGRPNLDNAEATGFGTNIAKYQAWKTGPHDLKSIAPAAEKAGMFTQSAYNKLHMQGMAVDPNSITYDQNHNMTNLTAVGSDGNRHLQFKGGEIVESGIYTDKNELAADKQALIDKGDVQGAEALSMESHYVKTYDTDGNLITERTDQGVKVSKNDSVAQDNAVTAHDTFQHLSLPNGQQLTGADVHQNGNLYSVSGKDAQGNFVTANILSPKGIHGSGDNRHLPGTLLSLTSVHGSKATDNNAVGTVDGYAYAGSKVSYGSGASQITGLFTSPNGQTFAGRADLDKAGNIVSLKADRGQNLGDKNSLGESLDITRAEAPKYEAEANRDGLTKIAAGIKNAFAKNPELQGMHIDMTRNPETLALTSMSAVGGGYSGYQDLNKVDTGKQVKAGDFEDTGTRNLNYDQHETVEGAGLVLDSTVLQQALTSKRDLARQITNPLLSKGGREGMIMAWAGQWASGFNQFMDESGVSMDYTRGDAGGKASVEGGIKFLGDGATLGASASASFGGQRTDENRVHFLSTNAANYLQNTYNEARTKFDFNTKDGRAQADEYIANQFQDYTSAMRVNALAARRKNYGASAGPAAAEEIVKKAKEGSKDLGGNVLGGGLP